MNNKSSERDILCQEVKKLHQVIARLRSEEGCPWDRVQTYKSLRPYIIEEAYEAVEAIDSGDPELMAEELGDLLLQVVFQARIGEENDDFDLAGIISRLTEKLIRRHPHVFGDERADTPEEVKLTWQAVKDAERENLVSNNKSTRSDAGNNKVCQQEEKRGRQDSEEMNKRNERNARDERDDSNETGESRENAGLAADADSSSLLADCQKNLPALLRAREVQALAAEVGFDWEEIEPVYDKVREELEEVREAVRQVGRQQELEQDLEPGWQQDREQISREVGDLLFAAVNLARFLDVNPEIALLGCVRRFKERFSFIEEKVESQNLKLTEMSLEELDAIWEEAKLDNEGGE